MFDLEYKNKKQLNEIKKKIEAKIDTELLDIKYCRSPYYEDEDYIKGLTAKRIGFFIMPFKDKDMLDKEIESICREIKEKQNSLK